MNVIDKPLCIIPVRGGSKRFPRKNIALLRGKPLLTYAIEAALESGIFETIHVSSEDEEILSLAGKYEQVEAIPRDPSLAGDRVRIVDLCKAILTNYRERCIIYSSFSVLLATSPLRTAQDIREAYGLLQDEKVNAVMSVVPFDHAPYAAVQLDRGGYLEFHFDRKYLGIRQELPELYRHDGAIYFSRTETFLANPVQYGDRVAPYFMPVERSVDIDTPLDLKWAEFLMKEREMNNKTQ